MEEGSPRAALNYEESHKPRAERLLSNTPSGKAVAVAAGEEQHDAHSQEGASQEVRM